MQSGWIIDGVAIVMALAAASAHAQVIRAARPGPRVLISSSGPPSTYPTLTGDIVREIDDPRNGDRWLLIENESHPGGPGRLVLADARGGPGDASEANETRATKQATREADTLPPVIRAGERVVVEEHTAMVEAHLEAVAMAPAWVGSAFNVRLSIGGRIVRVVAEGPGRAILQVETQR
jgi:hypothetical protein